MPSSSPLYPLTPACRKGVICEQVSLVICLFLTQGHIIINIPQKKRKKVMSPLAQVI